MATFDYSFNLAAGCSHNNSHNQVRGHRTASSHSGVEEYPVQYSYSVLESNLGLEHAAYTDH